MNKRFFLKTVAALTFAAVVLPSFAADDPSVPPDGSVSIVYWRADGDYKSWGVHAWVSIEGAEGAPIDGVDWVNPLKPKGKLEDGSVYFVMPLSAFGKDGMINYIIHKKDSKEQGGKDQHFDSHEAKQIWVNSGDVKIYTSKEEAVKARAAQ